MKLSYSNIGWSKEDDERVYAMLFEQGFSGVEIAPTRIFDPPAYEKTGEAERFCAELFERFGLCIPSMQSIWYGVQDSIFGDADERARLRSYTRKALDFADACSCRNLVFGCPKNRNMPKGALESTAVDFFAGICADAYEHGAVIALEANPPIYNTNYLNTTESAAVLARSLGAGAGLNLDFGTIVYNNEPIEALEEYMDVINHVHISEPYLAPLEKRAEHAKLARLLRESGYDGYVSIETKCADYKTVRKTADYIRGVFA